MKNRFTCYFLMILFLSPAPASAQAVVLTGKTTSKITAHVSGPNRFDVTDDKGGWFEQGLAMQQLGGWNTPYEVAARLRVLSTSRDFQVRLDEPLQIRNQGDPTKAFRQPSVSLGAEDGQPKALAVGQSTTFTNPAPPVAGTDSVGYYNLAVSAYPPEGDFKTTAGTYSGVLSLTFEPVVKAP
ncbi:CS1 type fimbrial major subunit [Burkholderia ambifaria]|uniref:CS1 type fimbrial major subunit n=1 Tax=Burkholderia ambifaria TaxID=152480 RepID=UPI0015886938|nr:CS1 type fimbrial major subunit [Burkholderia ambifaria]